MTRFSLALLLLCAGCATTRPAPTDPRSRRVAAPGELRSPKRSRRPRRSPGVERRGKPPRKLPTVRIRGRKRTPKPASIPTLQSRRAVLEAEVRALDGQLVMAVEWGSSPVRIAEVAWLRARALAQAGRPLEALADLDLVFESFATAEWFTRRFGLDGVAGFGANLQFSPQVRARALALRCWLRRVTARRSRVPSRQAPLDQVEALRLAPQDALVRTLVTRTAADLPEEVPSLRRWRRPALPGWRRLQWLAGAQVSAGSLGPSASKAWLAEENSKSLVAIARALALLGEGSREERLQRGGLLWRRARILELLGKPASARLDRASAVAFARGELGPTRYPELRLATHLGLVAFWGGDFGGARRIAQAALRRRYSWRVRGARLDELINLVSTAHAVRGLSNYALLPSQPLQSRARRLIWIGRDVWFPTGILADSVLKSMKDHALAAAGPFQTSKGLCNTVPCRDPRPKKKRAPRTPRAPQGSGCGNSGATHLGLGTCAGASCTPGKAWLRLGSRF